ncbi:sarcosine oxidase subunit beta [Arthrobacter livingstonensis]|uniref:Sarcosine oxidase subunit beta n=1 Tax=Arthrobacter livingstonensis TaxID=670078 RepID=A0A2V5LMM4_9MICC|nr:FAD-binding oxidoreductase [Arthrobacter livingstonensis]PYI68910.1 sarcosine oxidase subunit beta [Arthrobacter livingstonensis]
MSNVVSLQLPPGTKQPSNADVVIIGGGIMGTSIAFHLAEAGVRNIVLVDRSELGTGSSAKPLGGVRATFSDPANIVLGQRSLGAFDTFQQRFSTDIGLRKVGYLFLCRSESEMLDCERSTVIQNSLGGDSRMVSPAEAVGINPFLNQDALMGASYSPQDGFAEPGKVVRAYADAAAALGVRILEHTEVMDVGTTGGRISSVTTNRGTIKADAVICCAGAWSKRIGGMVDVSLPVVPVRRQIGLTRQMSTPMPTVPFTLDLSTTMYFHNYGNGMLLGISNSNQEPGFDRDFTHEWLPEFTAAARVCAPALADPDLEGGWAGLYENTPDHNALIGTSRSVEGFYYATGFSGHGFLQGPAVGELIRDLYLGRESFMDHTSFSADRFETAEHRIQEVHII